MVVKLDRRCRIEKPVNTIDPVYGSAEKTWQLLAVVWCNVQDVLPSRSEAVKNGLAVGTKQKRLRFRYRDDVDSSMRIMLDNVAHQIVGGPAELGQHEYLECVVEAYTS
jgi:head-tail adaptor